MFSVSWIAGDVKEPTHLSERVGHVVPGVVVSGLVSRVCASHRVNLIAHFLTMTMTMNLGYQNILPSSFTFLYFFSNGFTLVPPAS